MDTTDWDHPAPCPLCGEPPTSESHPACGVMLTCANGHRSEWGEWHEGIVRLEKSRRGTFKYRSV